MVRYELSTTDAKFLVDFIKFSEDNLSKKVINLFNRVKSILEYYYEADRNMKTDNKKGKPNFIHGIEKSPFEFKSLYKDNTEFCGGLLCFILHNCVEKLSGNKNLHYASRSLNLSIALDANGNLKCCEFVARKRGLVSLRHSRRIFAKKIIPTFINLTIDETVKNLQNHFCMLRKTICFSDSYIDLTVEVDATVVVKSWKILESCG